jgi:hypothetical protein
MTDEKKPDYSKFKTPGGVTTTRDGEAHPTALTDESRAAQVAALKNERKALAGRVDSNDDDHTAARRLRELDRSLAAFGEKVERQPGQPPQKATQPQKTTQPPQ